MRRHRQRRDGQAVACAGCATPAAKRQLLPVESAAHRHAPSEQPHAPRAGSVVDGRVAFTGGVADWWFKPHRGKPAWRDTMARIEGPIVAALQGVFAENWPRMLRRNPDVAAALAAARAGRFGRSDAASGARPRDRATVSRVVFQMLIEGAVAKVDISTPYFLPDRALAAGAGPGGSSRRPRSVSSSPATNTDPAMGAPGEPENVWGAARRRRSHLRIQAGDDTRESRDGRRRWAIIGTTNVDNRSFEHNDEINVAFREHDVTARLRDDFESDLAASDEITLEVWVAARCSRRWSGRSAGFSNVSNKVDVESGITGLLVDRRRPLLDLLLASSRRGAARAHPRSPTRRRRPGTALATAAYPGTPCCRASARRARRAGG